LHISPSELQAGLPKEKAKEAEKSIMSESLSIQMEKYEAEIISETLKQVNGNKTLAAKNLGVSVRNLYYKLEKHGIEKNSMQ
ncbi:MAG TPA: sigma-54-dependent Fis family transcriptional regulator, partial [Bacillus bacterium]|nr:sigma-54-dependent Fis family transcriptional regulator [Bacillus sp. (in: firmicutes)]